MKTKWDITVWYYAKAWYYHWPVSHFPNVCHIHVFVSKRLKISTKFFLRLFFSFYFLSPSAVPQCYGDPSAGVGTEMGWEVEKNLQFSASISLCLAVWPIEIKFGLVSHTEERHVCMGQETPCQGMGPQRTQFWRYPVLRPIPFHVEWTKFAVVTHIGTGVFLWVSCAIAYCWNVSHGLSTMSELLTSHSLHVMNVF